MNILALKRESVCTINIRPLGKEEEGGSWNEKRNSPLTWRDIMDGNDASLTQYMVVQPYPLT